jgi:hypothetical protein
MPSSSSRVSPAGTLFQDGRLLPHGRGDQDFRVGEAFMVGVSFGGSGGGSAWVLARDLAGNAFPAWPSPKAWPGVGWAVCRRSVRAISSSNFVTIASVAVPVSQPQPEEITSGRSCGVAQHQQRLAQRYRLFLDAAGVGHHQQAPGERIDQGR